jgi:hypothetical protein
MIDQQLRNRVPPAGDGTPIVRCLTAGRADLTAIDNLRADDGDGIHQLMASAAGWWWQAADLATDAGNPDLARVLAARARVLGLRADPEWDADDEAWMLDELERLLDFEEGVGAAMNQPGGAGVIIDVIDTLRRLHTARRDDDADTAVAGAVGA